MDEFVGASFRDGYESSSPLLVRLCDPLNGTSTVFMTTNNTGYVVFRSDTSITDSGFQIYWEAVSSGTSSKLTVRIFFYLGGTFWRFIIKF